MAELLPTTTFFAAGRLFSFLAISDVLQRGFTPVVASLLFQPYLTNHWIIFLIKQPAVSYRLAIAARGREIIHVCLRARVWACVCVYTYMGSWTFLTDAIGLLGSPGKGTCYIRGRYDVTNLCDVISRMCILGQFTVPGKLYSKWS